MILGITGGSGCGKTTLLQALKAQGALVLDCDEIYHDLLSSDQHLLHAISARFPGVVSAGSLDRKKLGAIVFADPTALEDLNAITHAAVRDEVLRHLASKPALAAIDAIALFESGLNELCDVTVAVCAPEDVRLRRIMVREGIPAEYAKMRIDAQRPQSDFRQICDHVLENDGSKQDFYGKCLAFFRRYCIMETEDQI